MVGQHRRDTSAPSLLSRTPRLARSVCCKEDLPKPHCRRFCTESLRNVPIVTETTVVERAQIGRSRLVHGKKHTTGPSRIRASLVVGVHEKQRLTAVPEWSLEAAELHISALRHAPQELRGTAHTNMRQAGANGHWSRVPTLFTRILRLRTSKWSNRRYRKVRSRASKKQSNAKRKRKEPSCQKPLNNLSWFLRIWHSPSPAPAGDPVE